MEGQMNLLVKHEVVGTFRGGAVVSQDAIDGGPAEVRRLVKAGALQWVQRPVTEDAPPADAAVALMSDDDLSAAFRAVRSRLQAVTAERDDLRDELAAAAARVADLERQLAAASDLPGALTLGDPDGSANDLSDDPEAAGADGTRPADLATVPVLDESPAPAVYGEPTAAAALRGLNRAVQDRR